MIKLVCTECNSDWFTANTAWDGCCEKCGGKLIESDDLLSHTDLNSIHKGIDAEREIASTKRTD